MTIKEAFEKLTATCSAGMKNPFFIMRNLHDSFADIADKIEGGGGGGSTVEVTQVVSSGTKIATIIVDDTPTDLYAPEDTGSEVSVTQVVSTGTKIATITVDDTPTDLYAPSSGGGGGDSHTYSSTEAEVGTWIDGTSKVYEITLTGTCPGHSSTGSAELPAGILKIISAHVVCGQGIGGQSPRFYQLPYITVAGLQYSTQVKFDTHSGKLYLEIMNANDSDIDASWTYTAIIRYIKTSS